MVKVTKIENNKLRLEGRTFDYKEQIKSIGGRWEPSTKSWSVEHTEHNIEVIKTFKKPRSCGFCGKIGHNKTKCEKYHSHCKTVIKKKAEKEMTSSESRFKFLKKKEYCSCSTIQKDHGYTDFIVIHAVICRNCQTLCCNQATIIPNHPDLGSFTCPRHGSHRDQVLNYTIGT